MSEFNHRESFAPTTWRRISAINGRGNMLLGPDEYGAGPGAMVVAPPGVLLRAPVGQEPLTRNGWRQARWGPDREGHVLVDQARPRALAEVDLAQVVEDVAEWSPEHLTWVAEVVERNIRVLFGRMQLDCKGVAEEGREQAFGELTELHRGADRAFAGVRDCDRVPAWLTDGHFSRMRHAYVLTLNLDKAAFERVRARASRDQINR